MLASADPAAAEREFRLALDLDPANVEAHHGLMRALTEQSRFEAAIAAALALTVLTPNDPLAHAALSIALMRAGHIPEAEAAAARARILEWKQQLAEPQPSEAFPIA
jgi:Flp pilus assembly protein TadD